MMFGILLQTVAPPATPVAASSDSLSLGPLIHLVIIFAVAFLAAIGGLVITAGVAIRLFSKSKGNHWMLMGAVMIASGVLLLPVTTLIGSWAQYGGTSFVNALSHLEPQGTVGNPFPATPPAPTPTPTPVPPAGH
jgi:hypothetical protein